MKEKRNILYFIGGVLACVAIVAMGVFTAVNIVNNIYTEAMSNINDQISRTSAEVSNFTKEKLDAVKTLAELAGNQIQHENRKEEYQGFIESLSSLEAAKTFDSIGIADASGMFYLFQNQIYTIRNERGFQRVMQGEALISAPAAEMGSQEKALWICAPIYKEGTIIGMLSGSWKISRTQALVQDFYHGNGYCHIVNNEGDVIVHSANPNSSSDFQNLFTQIREGLANADDAPSINDQIAAAFLTNEPGTQRLDMEGEDKILGYQSVAGYNDWNVLCVIREDSIWEQSWPLVIKTLLLTCGAVSILILSLILIGLTRFRSARKLEQAAYDDPITGGKNYAYFRRNVPAVLKKNKAQSYFMIRIDIERFKNFNTSFGYDKGDALLKRVYTFFNDLYPESQDQLAVRMHSDEFVILAKDPGGDYPLEPLLDRLKQLEHENDLMNAVSFALGVYRLKNTEESLDNMVDKAQLAKINFKKTHMKNSYIYSDDLLEAVARDAILESNSKMALKNGEFLVYQQPKVDLKTEKVVSAEALIRWKSPSFGFLSPAKFIPVFERNGFIQELDFYVLECVCKLLRDMKERGEPLLPIAVNQSRLHAYNPSYRHRLKHTVEKYGVDPGWIELEITESVILDNMEPVLETIRAVREMGFQVSIDDFGSGYTSLSFLQDVDVDVIKMDRSLVVGSEESEKKKRMLQYLIEMSHALGMTVVCEGMETARQVELMRSMGCDIAQGYYYARPMPVEDFGRYVQDHR